MLKKKARLHKNYQFRYVYKHGRAVSDRTFTLIVCPSKQPTSMFGFSVSRKNGCAVRRNRLKRLMRESVRLLYPDLKPHCNAILAASSKYIFDGTLTFKEASARVRALLSRAGLLTKPTPTESC